MHCEQFQELLVDQIDGPLSQDAREHLGVCAQCRGLHDDLQAIAVSAHEWGAEDPAPPARVWASIAASLEAEGLIRQPVAPVAVSWWAAWWRLSWFDRLEHAGAFALLAILAVGVVGYRGASIAGHNEDTVSSAQQTSSQQLSLNRIASTLDGNMQTVVASFAPDSNRTLATSLKRNLQIVDTVIAECEKSVREHPDDPLVREYLYGAYQQKAEILAAAVDRSSLEAQ